MGEGEGCWDDVVLGILEADPDVWEVFEEGHLEEALPLRIRDPRKAA